MKPYFADTSLFVAFLNPRDDKGWWMTDCVSIVGMRAHGLTEAVTSDHYFVQAGFGILLK